VLQPEEEKKIAAEAAVEHVADGMLVGLGTGSTAKYATLAIGARVAVGLRVTACPSSLATEQLARSVNIPLVDFSQVSGLDLTIDGADEIDPALQAVKGGGGALFREKVLAAASNTMIAVVDSSKLVDRLGAAKVPVEVQPFAAAFVERELKRLTERVQLRAGTTGAPFITDQGNCIFDLFFDQPYDPSRLAAALKQIPGVLEHGLFLDEIDVMIVAQGGKIVVKKRPGKP
jgi:ribose 5-phosphate isomerase A